MSPREWVSKCGIIYNVVIGPDQNQAALPYVTFVPVPIRIVSLTLQ